MRVRRFLLIILVILTTISFIGCNTECEYTFDQELENIKSIEIRRLDYYFKKNESSVIVTLDENESKKLIDDISIAKCSLIRAPSAMEQSCGYIVVYIIYENGEVEVIGSMNSAKIDKNGEWDMQHQAIEHQEFKEIIFKYVDKDLVPELVSEYPEITSKP